MAKKKNKKARNKLSTPKQVKKAIKQAAKDGEVTGKEVRQISRRSVGTVNSKTITNLVKDKNVEAPKKVRALAKKARGNSVNKDKKKGKKLKGIDSNTPMYKDLKFDPKNSGKNIPKYVAAPNKSKKDKPKDKPKDKGFGTTINPVNDGQPNKFKKWQPAKVEQTVKKNWNELKKQYSGPKRLKINSSNTGLLKKYENKKGNFERNKFLSDIKTSTSERYKRKGGTAASLKKEPTPNFDKIPDEYGRSLNNVRSSLSGIKKKPTADSVGSKLTKSYTTAPAKKATRKKRGLNILGISNSSITAS